MWESRRLRKANWISSTRDLQSVTMKMRYGFLKNTISNVTRPIILGIDWDKKDFQRLYRYIKKLKLVFVNLQPFTPMPGTGYFHQYENSLIIPYDEHEKWDMAHLVVKPANISVRQYYWQIVKLYYKVTMIPKNVIYMFGRYGVGTTLKLSLGAAHITKQYLKKIIKG